jgi:aarF domain-containing kinase
VRCSHLVICQVSCPGHGVFVAGFYLKQAQTVSTRDEFIPKDYMEFCKRMQDKVPTEFAPGEAKTLVAKTLGRPFDDVFTEWDEEPLGIASIGEVHRARLKDGREVAVKVMMPGIEAKFRADLKTLLAFCRVAQPQHVKPLEEIEVRTRLVFVATSASVFVFHNSAHCCSASS